MIGKMVKKVSGLALVCAGATGLLVACSGGTGDGGSEDSGSGTFVAKPESVGTIELTTCQERPPVGEACGFFVGVKDASGAAVPGMPISCDTEDGLALIEPTKGSEITDSIGAISGKIGCEKPGSLLLMCRLAVGAFLRKSVTVKCQGPIPQGFTGFPDAGGGNLGGGGGVTDGSVTLTEVTFSEAGESSTVTIDTSYVADCTPSDLTDTVDEPFTDTLVQLKVKNTTNSSISFPYYSFTVNSAETGARLFSSSNIALQGTSVDVAPGETATFNSFFAYGNIGSGVDKYYAGSSTALSDGVQNVRVTVHGVTADGQEADASATIALSFGAYNRCP